MSYIKENISTVVSDCFDQIITPPVTTTPAEPTVTEEPANATKETITIFTEGDEVFEQKESFDPESKELTLSVPAHGGNVALKAIIGVDKMITSYDNYCVFGDPPADHTTEVSERSTDNVDEVNSESVVKIYSFNLVEGEMTEAERAELPESFKTACKDKPILKTARIVVDENTFMQDSLDSVESRRRKIVPKDMDLRFEDIGLSITSRQNNCSSQKVQISNYFLSMLN